MSILQLDSTRLERDKPDSNEFIRINLGLKKSQKTYVMFFFISGLVSFA